MFIGRLQNRNLATPLLKITFVSITRVSDRQTDTLKRASSSSHDKLNAIGGPRMSKYVVDMLISTNLHRVLIEP